MPKKVQLKLLSPSGELLNVVTCYGGQVTVFRANTTADLRPYQRALSGSPGKERFSINVDGKEYSADNRVVVGLGEDPPYSGITVRELFEQCGISDSSAQALMTSYGIDTPIATPCASLSADIERRLRLLVATCDPTKIVVLHEPFENVSSQWRERFAELLANFARLKGGLVIVTGLSYRPENWIDNEVIARAQVGDTIQRTIGFGASGSQSTNAMNQLRDMVRAENEAMPPPQPERTTERTPSHATVTAAAFIPGTASQHTNTHADAHVESAVSSPLLSEIIARIEPVTTFLSAKPVVSGVVLASLGIGLTSFALFGGGAERSAREMQASIHSQAPSQKDGVPSDTLSTDQTLQNSVTTTLASDEPSSSLPQVRNTHQTQQPPRVPYILDGYNDMVRVSLLETARGSIPSEGVAPPSEPQGPPTSNKNTGNLFKLLESASSKGPDRPGSSDVNAPVEFNGDAPPPPPTEWTGHQEDPADADASEEQQRREAIRQKFLEAIRAAAEKRQAAADDSGM